MKKSTFWTIIGIGAVGVLTGGAGFLAAPAIGAAVSAAGLGVAGGTLSGCAASSFALGVASACTCWEKGEISEAKNKIKQLANKDHAQFKKFYNKNKANMSDDLRREWEKYL